MVMKKILLLLCIIAVSACAHAADRIISAGSGITEIIYALGAQKKLIAVDSTSRQYTTKDTLTVLGYHRQLATEPLLALNPDTLVGSQEMGPQSTLQQLAAAGVNVVIAPSGNNIDALYARIDTIAKITGSQKQAEVLKNNIHQSVEELKNQSLDKSPKVLFMLAHGGRVMFGGAGTSVDEIIRLAGAINPAADHFDSYKTISMEKIVELQPDYLLITQQTVNTHGGIDEFLKAYPLLNETPAGKNKAIILVPETALIGELGIESIKLSHQLNDTFSG